MCGAEDGKNKSAGRRDDDQEKSSWQTLLTLCACVWALGGCVNGVVGAVRVGTGDHVCGQQRREAEVLCGCVECVRIF